jgi:hypothetical protein
MKKNKLKSIFQKKTYCNYLQGRLWIFNRGITILDDDGGISDLTIAISIVETRIKEMFSWSQ